MTKFLGILCKKSIENPTVQSAMGIRLRNISFGEIGVQPNINEMKFMWSLIGNNVEKLMSLHWPHIGPHCNYFLELQDGRKNYPAWLVN